MALSRVVLQRPGSVAPPPPRSSAASAVVNGKLYVFGGYGGPGTIGRLDDFYSFSLKGDDDACWEVVDVLSDERPGCRECNPVAVVVAGDGGDSNDSDDSSRTFYLYGGYDGTKWLNDLWTFDVDARRWIDSSWFIF